MRADPIREPQGTTTVLPPDTMRRQEVDHRVANSLQLISSLLSLQARQAADRSVREALGAAVHRIGAVGAIHKRLHRSSPLYSIDIAPFTIMRRPAALIWSREGPVGPCRNP